MATYKRADDEITDLVVERMDNFFPALYGSEVRVDTLLAYGRRDGETLVSPAISRHGYACLAVVRITSLKERALGHGDAELTLDGDRWPQLSVAGRDGLIDHELTHLDVIWEDEGNGVPKADDAGRPRLKIRKHDFEIGGFHSIAERHLSDAPEVKAVHAALGQLGTKQLYFPMFEFMDEESKEAA